MVQPVNIMATILTGAAFALGYVRYRAYVDEVQRDLFMCLEGRTYPRLDAEYSLDDVQFEVVNVDVETRWLKNWYASVVLKLKREEFPWADSDLDDFDYRSEDVPEQLNPAGEKDADSIEELMAEELREICDNSREMEIEFEPSFVDSVYGPALFLHFSTTNLFVIREQLEMVSTALPFLFTGWVDTLVGLDTKFVIGSGMGFSENSESTGDESDEE